MPDIRNDACPDCGVRGKAIPVISNGGWSECNHEYHKTYRSAAGDAGAEQAVSSQGSCTFIFTSETPISSV